VLHDNFRSDGEWCDKSKRVKNRRR